MLVGAAVGAGPLELKRAEAILKENIDLIVVDTAHGHSKKVADIIKAIRKMKTNAAMTYPGGAPMRRETVCFSMYSDMSMRITASSVSNMNSASALQR